MNELFLSVFSVSVVIGIATHLAHARYRDRVRGFALGTIFLFVIISSFSSLDAPNFDVNDFLPESGESGGEYYYVVKDAVGRGISEAVAKEFGFTEEDVSVTLIGFDVDNMKCETVVITLGGRAAVGDYKRVEEFVSKIGIGRCRVDVQIG